MASIVSETHSTHQHMNGSGGVPPMVGQSSVPAFALRLAEHQKELHRFVWQLFDTGVHTDVTIALDDGQYIRAHKLILSAFSSYFRQVLTRISPPYQYPVIVVKDMLYEDVRSLVEFMYRGCITVPNHRLPQLLKCAKHLKIRGLYETNEENIENHYNYYKNVSQNAQTLSPNVKDVKSNQFSTFGQKSVQNKGICCENSSKDCNPKQDLVNDWLNKRSDIPVSNLPKFSIPEMTSLQQKIALDLTKPMDLNKVQNAVQTTDQCFPVIKLSPNICTAFRSPHPHPPLFRSTSVDECQLNKNKIFLNGIDVKLKRAPSSLDGYLDDNNNDLDPERKEKKRNLNIFHAAKYRNRKKQQLELLFAEESELQKKNCSAKVQIEKLESTILSLIWQQTKRSFNSQTVFSCPVCGSTQSEVSKLRSHINMLHNDTEALMKFLILQRSSDITNSANNSNSNNSANPFPNSTLSVPFSANSDQ